MNEKQNGQKDGGFCNRLIKAKMASHLFVAVGKEFSTYLWMSYSHHHLCTNYDTIVNNISFTALYF